MKGKDLKSIQGMIINIALACLLLAGIYIIFIPGGVGKSQKKSGLSFRDMKTYRTQVERRLQIKRTQVEFENLNKAPGIRTGKLGVKARGSEDGGFSHDAPERNHGVLDTHTQLRAATSSSLENRINRFQNIRQKYNELADIEKQRYIEQFKTEAKSLGYDVDVDDDLNITTINKVQGE